MPLGTACWCSAISGALGCAENAMTKILKRLTQNLRKFGKFLMYVTIDDNSFLLKKETKKNISEINLFYCFCVDFLGFGRLTLQARARTHIYIYGEMNAYAQTIREEFNEPHRK